MCPSHPKPAYTARARASPPAWGRRDPCQCSLSAPAQHGACPGWVNPTSCSLGAPWGGGVFDGGSQRELGCSAHPPLSSEGAEPPATAQDLILRLSQATAGRRARQAQAPRRGVTCEPGQAGSVVTPPHAPSVTSSAPPRPAAPSPLPPPGQHRCDAPAWALLHPHSAGRSTTAPPGRSCHSQAPQQGHGDRPPTPQPWIKFPQDR